MGEIISQLGHLFLRATPTIIVVFLLFVILDRIFFRPLLSILKQREESTVGALARAREQVAAAEAKTRQYEDALQNARQEVYRQREAYRRTHLSGRDAALLQARQQAEVMIRNAQAGLAADVARTKTELDSACKLLAEEISQTLLEPASPPGPGGGVPS